MDYIIIVHNIICPSPVPTMPNTNGVKLCCDVSGAKYILILSVYILYNNIMTLYRAIRSARSSAFVFFLVV